MQRLRGWKGESIFIKPKKCASLQNHLSCERLCPDKHSDFQCRFGGRDRAWGRSSQGDMKGVLVTGEFGEEETDFFTQSHQ